MKDIDKNINSLVYEVTSGDYLNDINSSNGNIKVIHSIAIKKAGLWSVTLEPGEYYYKHVFYPLESVSSTFFITIYSEKFSFPFHTYYAQSALKGSSAFNIIIPWHFVINDTFTFNISVNSINNENTELNSLIEISKKVN